MKTNVEILFSLLELLKISVITKKVVKKVIFLLIIQSFYSSVCSFFLSAPPFDFGLNASFRPRRTRVLSIHSGLSFSCLCIASL